METADLYEVEITYKTSDGLISTETHAVNFSEIEPYDYEEGNKKLTPAFPFVIQRISKMPLGETARFYRLESASGRSAVYVEVSETVPELHILVLNMGEVIGKLDRIIKGLKL